MYDHQSSLRCANCGTPLEAPGKGAPGVTCPVCQFFNTLIAPLPAPELTLEALEARLGDLVAQARTSGIPLDSIVHLLRDELEFSAELANGDRDLCVQIIDLGPRVGQPLRRSSRDDSMMLRGRSVGG
jgi:LSD1 subclass zinc finger protein